MMTIQQSFLAVKIPVTMVNDHSPAVILSTGQMHRTVSTHNAAQLFGQID